MKVPQIVKIVLAKSSEGLSITPQAFETAALVITVVYNYRNNNPFSFVASCHDMNDDDNDYNDLSLHHPAWQHVG